MNTRSVNSDGHSMNTLIVLLTTAEASSSQEYILDQKTSAHFRTFVCGVEANLALFHKIK